MIHRNHTIESVREYDFQKNNKIIAPTFLIRIFPKDTKELNILVAQSVLNLKAFLPNSSVLIIFCNKKLGQF